MKPVWERHLFPQFEEKSGPSVRPSVGLGSLCFAEKFNHSSLFTLAQKYLLYLHLWKCMNGKSCTSRQKHAKAVDGKHRKPTDYIQMTHVKNLLSSDWNVCWTMVWMQNRPWQAQTITLHWHKSLAHLSCVACPTGLKQMRASRLLPLSTGQLVNYVDGRTWTRVTWKAYISLLSIPPHSLSLSRSLCFSGHSFHLYIVNQKHATWRKPSTWCTKAVL